VSGAITAKLSDQWGVGPKADYGQIALNSFASALGNSVVEKMKSGSGSNVEKKDKAKAEEAFEDALDQYDDQSASAAIDYNFPDSKKELAGMFGSDAAAVEHLMESQPGVQVGEDGLVFGLDESLENAVTKKMVKEKVEWLTGQVESGDVDILYRTDGKSAITDEASLMAAFSKITGSGVKSAHKKAVLSTVAKSLLMLEALEADIQGKISSLLPVEGGAVSDIDNGLLKMEGQLQSVAEMKGAIMEGTILIDPYSNNRKLVTDAEGAVSWPGGYAPALQSGTGGGSVIALGGGFLSDLGSKGKNGLGVSSSNRTRGALLENFLHELGHATSSNDYLKNRQMNKGFTLQKGHATKASDIKLFGTWKSLEDDVVPYSAIKSGKSTSSGVSKAYKSSIKEGIPQNSAKFYTDYLFERGAKSY